LFRAIWWWMLALSGAYYLFPAAALPLWAAIGVTSSGAVVAGVYLNQPRRRLPWLLVALAILTLTAGDVTYLYLTRVLGESNPFPAVSDIIYLAMYPILVTGLLLLPRSTTGRDRSAVIDSLVVTCGLGLLAWIFLINPNLHDQSLSTSAQLASIAYPVFDILFLAASARLLIEVPRTVSVVLMAIGGVSLLATDSLYGASQLANVFTGMGGPLDIGWIVFYATWGAAALHPSMRQLTEPRIQRDSPVSVGRMGVLTLAALVAPAVLLIETARGSQVDAIPIGVLSAVVFLLVLLRLAGVVQSYRKATEREQSLREAGGALVFASDPDMVRSVVLSAVSGLFRPGEGYEAALPFKAETLNDESIDRERREGAIRDPLPPRFIRTSTIQSTEMVQLRRHEIALVVPMVVRSRAVGEPLIGTLVVAADDRRLGELQSTLEALAAQGALAMERITLTEEVGRHSSEQYFRTLVQNTADVILIVGENDVVRYASPSATALFGPGVAEGHRLPELVVEEQRPLAEDALDRVHRGEYPEGEEYWSVVRADGSTGDVEISLRDLRDEPTVTGLVLTVRDVTDRLRLERELTHLAFHDPLTGLANRVRFGDQVQEAVNRHWEGDNVVGVLFLDVDDFKVVNDTMGHETGDQLIEEVARRLSTVIGPGDVAARLGGDEFAVLVEHARNSIEVEQVAARIVSALAEPVVIGGAILSASSSIGVATTVDASSRGDLLRQADLALYVAKGSGKGRWRRYQSALHTEMVKRLELRSALDKAVAQQDFVLAYQPIVSLIDGRPVGFEALLRWDDPERGLVLPGQFIDVAEDSGLIVPIGEWALPQAMHDAVAWSAGDGAPPYLSINISVRQFRAPGLVETIHRGLESSGLAPDRLVLEITESLLLREDDRVWADLHRLRELGIRLAIDDFGTGYSSLSYLRQVPVDMLKIDKSFIDTMGSSKEQRSLVETIVRLAKTLGLDVVAEGIQRTQDRDMLIDIGCPYGQGFLFAAGMNNEELHRWLRSHVTQTA
jgi:diguanylate cyclase (GGDEF)-like protein/PAS domain S-box-containing protein